MVFSLENQAFMKNILMSRTFKHHQKGVFMDESSFERSFSWRVYFSRMFFKDIVS